jgi:hypothetical protein
MQAPLAKPGRLSWLEREIHDFTCYLANRLAGWRRHEEAAPRQRAVVS